MLGQALDILAWNRRGHALTAGHRPIRRWLDELKADTRVIRRDFHLFGAAPAEHTAALLEDFGTGTVAAAYNVMTRNS